ncbi:MAG TPA: cytochrome c biogenesis protein ResB [Deferrisomatales bacterium]|nr:cytochrome c biogenesis protein ResB [Deferrisomatales bacterium]
MAVLGWLWRVASAPVTFVVLSILWCIDLAAGSIHAYRLDPQFWVKMDAVPFNQWLTRVAPTVWPASWWVYGLVALTYLVIASLLICTLNWFFRRRRRARGMGEVLVHLGFLLVFAGFVLGSGWGVRTQGVEVAVGGTTPVPDQGLELRLDGVEVLRSPDGRPLDTVSRVALLRDGAQVADGTVRTNHPLISGATVVYPQGARSQITGARVAVERGGVHTLTVGGPLLLGDGRSLVLRQVLHPGDRLGPYFGPGFLVDVVAADGTPQAQGFLSPVARGALTLAGVGLRLVDVEISPAGVFNVHRDPGVLLVLVGAAILTIGTFWALAGYLWLWQLRPVADTE